MDGHPDIVTSYNPPAKTRDTLTKEERESSELKSGEQVIKHNNND